MIKVSYQCTNSLRPIWIKRIRVAACNNAFRLQRKYNSSRKNGILQFSANSLHGQLQNSQCDIVISYASYPSTMSNFVLIQHSSINRMILLISHYHLRLAELDDKMERFVAQQSTIHEPMWTEHTSKHYDRPITRFGS